MRIFFVIVNILFHSPGSILPSQAASMAREKSWIWEHFHQGPGKVDKVHWQARCKYCVTVKTKELENADQQAIAHGILQAARTPAILTQEGESSESSINVLHTKYIICTLCTHSM
jgi:hypothetical protein